jgi:hypothetical protein
MKAPLLLSTLFLYSIGFSQIGKEDPMRGPNNIPSPGVVDGVVLKDELPVRSKIEYEHVRLADYVWSKRVFSRIDKREKLNHSIFFPYDSFNEEYKSPKNSSEVENNPLWNKHQDRYSLWTIIQKHIMLGDLSVYRVSDPFFEIKEDGYQFKYPIIRNAKDDYFTDENYRTQINKVLASTGPPTEYEYTTVSGNKEFLRKTNLQFQTGNVATGWLDSLQALPEYADIMDNKDKIRVYWEQAKSNEVLMVPGPIRYLSSEGIVAYNIKEDWFFDKERSILDRRIIAIAPVANYAYEVPPTPEDYSRGSLIIYEYSVPKVGKGSKFEEYTQLKEEKEMFWLYFPEFRDVIVNYYVYNEKSDSQWMSFDDLFWKRKFSSTIFRVSDKFDREIEDYKYGVDALYEAERIKDDIRKWEIDVWNY